MAVKIVNVDELGALLGKVYWVESQLELSSQWEAYMEPKMEKYREIIFQISHDSEGHKSMLKKTCSNIEGIDIIKAAKEIKDKEFNFRRLKPVEILAEILKYEFLALDLYTKIHSFTDKEAIKEIWKGEDPEDYFKNFKWLMNQEKGHIKLLKPHVGRIERIL